MKLLNEEAFPNIKSVCIFYVYPMHNSACAFIRSMCKTDFFLIILMTVIAHSFFNQEVNPLRPKPLSQGCNSTLVI